MISLLQPGTSVRMVLNDSNLKFYTRFPKMKILNVLFTYIADSITANSTCAYSTYQMLPLILMRPHLDFSINDLAYRINISSSMVSSKFLKLIT